MKLALLHAVVLVVAHTFRASEPFRATRYRLAKRSRGYLCV
jgi:hypothetical protein